MVGVFERVYEVGPVFRAEPHDTTRHINEYVSLDVEFGFIENHFTVMALLRDVLAHIFASAGAALCRPSWTWPAPACRPCRATIPHIHFAEAQELILARHGVDVRGEPDLSPQDERWLGEWAQAEHGSDFLFVTGYPMAKRPFYTHPDPARPGYSNSFDLLFRGTELVTGGQRLHRYDDYQAALAERGLPEEPFATYLEAFRYGMPPHGGFAIGTGTAAHATAGAAQPAADDALPARSQPADAVGRWLTGARNAAPTSELRFSPHLRSAHSIIPNYLSKRLRLAKHMIDLERLSVADVCLKRSSI